ncbi:MAG TPA: caspase family protein, partial [Bradyrhizobium sp.]|nr:caspase family protein [Bradyrhizobium sp.]
DTPATSKPPENRMAAADASADEPAAGPIAVARTQGPSLASLSAGPPPVELVKSVQTELRRVGCLTAAADGEWKTASQRSLTLFNKHAGTKLNVKLASLDALDAIKLRSTRICPLICEHGFRPDGDNCSKIVCAEGSFLNENNECQKRRAKRPTARREPDDRPARVDRLVRERRNTEASAGKTKSSGQIVCDRLGCKPVDPGCHIELRITSQAAGDGGSVQVCR